LLQPPIDAILPLMTPPCLSSFCVLFYPLNTTSKHPRISTPISTYLFAPLYTNVQHINGIRKYPYNTHCIIPVHTRAYTRTRSRGSITQCNLNANRMRNELNELNELNCAKITFQPHQNVNNFVPNGQKKG
jgi:hypothetical protein